jgi:REP element-mobilizing transposase RayT
MDFSGLVMWGDALFWQTSSQYRSGINVWTPAAGAKPFVRWVGDGTRGAGNFGTDGVDMVWSQGEGKQPTETLYPTRSVMTAPFTSDPAAVVPRRLRAQPPADVSIGVQPFQVGCGYAAHGGGSCDVLVVRLADGWGWTIRSSEPNSARITCSRSPATRSSSWGPSADARSSRASASIPSDRARRPSDLGSGPARKPRAIRSTSLGCWTLGEAEWSESVGSDEIATAPLDVEHCYAQYQERGNVRAMRTSTRRRRRPAAQLALRAHGARGGYRANAGRPRGRSDHYVPHLARPSLGRRDVVHVTIRCVEGIPSLRRPQSQRFILGVLAAEKRKKGFRLVHYVVQRNHLHLVCEADGPKELSRGVQRLGARIGRGVNKLWQRSGRLFADRFHERVLTTPRQVRNVLAYVLLNRHKDLARIGWELVGLDPCSSGRFFDGWADAEPRGPPGPGEPGEEEAPVTRARSWLLRTGWRRHGLIRTSERAPVTPA